MAANVIRAFEKPVQDLFSDKFLFSIPPFQRPYAWTREQTGELLDDLCYAMTEQGAGSAPYFLGTIVVIKDPNAAAADVVDGQQRLATLTILLAVLRDLSSDDDARQIDPYIRQVGNRFAGITDSYRVNLRDQDQGTFQKHVQTMGATNTLPDPEQFASDSQSRLIENTLFLRKTLVEWSEEQRVELLTYIVQQCYLVVVQATDREAAYRVFAVMNDRGLDLSPTDVLKAEIIGAIPEEDRDNHNSTWELLEEGLGRDRFKDLFNHIEIIFHRQKRRTSLEQAFRDHVLKFVTPAQFIQNYLEPFGESYLNLIDSSYRSSQHAEEINRLIGQLWRLDYSDWQPFALAAMVQFHAQPAALLDAFRRLERTAYGFFIMRTHVNNRVGRFCAAIDELATDKHLPPNGSAIDLTTDEQAEILRVLDGPIYPITRVRKLLLLRLDEALSDGSASYDHRVVSVEHVLPQRPNSESQWVSNFPEPTMRRSWTHRLANLVLLSRKKNSAASNMEFDAKKERYFQRDGTSPFAITSQVICQVDWTPELLTRRQSELISVLKKVWSLGVEEVPLPAVPQLTKEDTDETGVIQLH